MDKKTRMGRGLDALFGETAVIDAPGVGATDVPLDAIEHNPWQPRKQFDEDELNSLSESIKAHGVLQPIVVRQHGERYQLIAGERRLRAARAAGLEVVPIRVVDLNDQQVVEAALVENIQRADLNPIEKAQGFKDYLERFAMTHDVLAKRLGLARPTITNLVALLDLPQAIQDAVRMGQLSTGHAKLLKGIADRERQELLAKEIIARGLSVHAAEALLKGGSAEAEGQERGSREPKAEPEAKTAHVQGIENELRQKLGIRFEIRLKGKEKGQFVLNFDSNDDFERVIELLRR